MTTETVRPGPGDITLSGFVAAACVSVVLVCAAYWLSLQQSRASAWVSHTHEVLTSIARTRAALTELQGGLRGFIISGNEEDLAPYQSARAGTTEEIARLRTLVADNAEQTRRLGDLESALSPRLASAAQLIAARRDGGFAAAKSILDTGLPRQQIANLRSVLNSLEAEEEQLLRERLLDHELRVRWFWAGMATVVSLLVVALAVLYLQLLRRRAAHQALLASENRLRLERIRIDEELQGLNRSLEATVRTRTAELRTTNADLLQAKQGLRDLSLQLITAQEQERRDMAVELDRTGQSLAVIRMHLTDLQRGTGGDAALVPDCIGVTDAAIAHVRAMVMSLRPTMLDDLGLVEALEWALDQQAQGAGWKAAFDAGDVSADLPPDIRTACFRIAQEALTNAARHAGATEVKLQLKMAGNDLELTVCDNGAGFDLQRCRLPEERKNHVGLVTMAERAGLVGGTLDIETAPGHGTRIRASLPVALVPRLAEPASLGVNSPS